MGGGLDEAAAELGWECPYCASRLEFDVRPVDVGPEGLVNVIEACCEVWDVRWFPPSFAVGRSRAADE